MILTPSPDGLSVLVATDVAGVATIRRADDAGTRAVRTPAGLLPAAGPVTVRDYEAAHGMVTYVALSAAGAYLDTATTHVELSTPILMAPRFPLYAVPVEAVTSYGAVLDPSSTFHTIMGRRDPVAVLGVVHTRIGSMSIPVESPAAGLDMAGLFDTGEVLHLRQRVPGLDMYFSVTGFQIQPSVIDTETTTEWEVQVSYTELESPQGGQLGVSDWSYADLRARESTYSSLLAHFPSYAAVSRAQAVTA